MGQLADSPNKLEWRRIMKQARDELDVTTRTNQSKILCEKVEYELLAPLREQLRRPLTVCIYAAFRSEADPSAILSRSLVSGDRCLAPRVVHNEAEMELRVVTAVSPWSRGRWSVPEPDPMHTELWDLAQPIDVVLVPGLAFNVRGERLGYGGGYYDRLYEKLHQVSQHPSLWIGFGYSNQFIGQRLPTETHDLKLDGVVTDQQFCWTTKTE
ncbi:MAG: 5-formyltetrahydrofolate cyclo-ligase [Candidatus Cohnella colombiensis]|uniref:5-formyltetrahydrofolate cyclo-ligase n=1 Tax=Candidatus Cohnella colombiensis TaxID=3121368 RepID=A0AA95EY74_9BACL|nr:MAG: 5-formyltetrahydrofolate cyclo-ligase [Cohnella sp.]